MQVGNGPVAVGYVSLFQFETESKEVFYHASGMTWTENKMDSSKN